MRNLIFSNGQTGYAVWQASLWSSPSDLFSITGPLANLKERQIYQVYGSWTRHPKFGRQFQCQRFSSFRPTEPDQIVALLGSGIIKGIGNKTAELIVKKFGSSSLDILDKNPNRLKEVPGIGAKKCKQIIAAWKGQKSTHELALFLSANDIALSFQNKIYKQYGDEAVKTVSDNPYALVTDISGIGFHKADQIAQNLGVQTNSLERVCAATVHLLKDAANSGHTYVTSEKMIETLLSLLQISLEALTPTLAQCLSRLHEESILASYKSRSGEMRHALSRYLNMEKQLADRLYSRTKITKHKLSESLQKEFDKKLKEKAYDSFSDEQQLAIQGALQSNTIIITGGPGVGKTTVCNKIIELFESIQANVLACAPTGRAAKRLEEVTGVKCKTIHRLLEFAPESAAFNRNDDNPVEADLILVDETSMLDTDLAHALFEAINPETKIILVGDVDQLPSVGAGCFLKDLIDWGAIPIFQLTKIFRQKQASKIVQNAHAINCGKAIDFELNANSDFFFLEALDAGTVFEKIQKLIQSKFFIEKKFNLVTDVQFLAPMKKGDLGCENLNSVLQRHLNPHAAGESGTGNKNTAGKIPGPGDKVIQMVNDYELGVYNGDIGTVEQKDKEGLIVDFAGRMVRYDNQQANGLRLGYAITIHKSQGSEFDVAVLILSRSHYVMLQRNLLYTAITRAAKYLFIIGDKKALQMAIANDKALQRQTNLPEQLQSMAGRLEDLPSERTGDTQTEQ